MNSKTAKQSNAQFMRTMKNVDAGYMRDPSGTEAIVQKYVLVFDFCSSTSILENLKDYEPDAWWNLLVEVEHFLTEEQTRHKFNIYKFIGDGWILVFDIDYSVNNLFGFMVKLHQTYD